MLALPQSFSVTVDEVKVESPDTVTLFLDAHGHRDYRAGQYLSIAPHQFRQLTPFIAWLEAQKGRKEPHRKYSMTSAPHEERAAITVKEEEFVAGRTLYPPLLSSLLARGLPRGESFTVFGYSGPYVLSDTVEPGRLIVHLVAGTGAVPNFSILKDALHRGLDLRHLYIASNKRREDLLFHDELLVLEREFPSKLKVVNTLTRDSLAGFRAGRINQQMLEELIPPAERASCLVYACGPAIHPWTRKAAFEAGITPEPRFMETVLGHLHSMGIDDRRIKRETYG